MTTLVLCLATLALIFGNTSLLVQASPPPPSPFSFWQAQPPPNSWICKIEQPGARFGKSEPHCPRFCSPSHLHLQCSPFVGTHHIASHCHNYDNHHQPPPFITHKQGSAEGEGSSRDTRGHRRDGLWQPSLTKGMLVRLFDHFMLNCLDFSHFSRVWTHLGVLGTQGNTGGMGYDSHPSQKVC